jgi:hypothetical protein
METRTVRNLALVASLVIALAGCGGSSSSGSNTNPNPVIMSPQNGSTLPSATIGAVYTQVFSVTSGGTAPYSFVPAGLPPGLTFTTLNTFSGSLSGTPTQAGVGTFALQVIDSQNQITQLSYTLTVNNVGGGAITISPATLPAGTNGTLYSQNLSAGSGTPPFTWGGSGTLPPGIQLGSSTSNAVTLSGTPTTAGTYNFSITVSDSSNPVLEGTQSYSVTIN